MWRRLNAHNLSEHHTRAHTHAHTHTYPMKNMVYARLWSTLCIYTNTPSESKSTTGCCRRLCRRRRRRCIQRRHISVCTYFCGCLVCCQRVERPYSMLCTTCASAVAHSVHACVCVFSVSAIASVGCLYPLSVRASDEVCVCVYFL